MKHFWNSITLVIFRMLPSWLSKWIVFWLKQKFVVGVVAVVPNQVGDFLFLHHTYRKSRAWRMPGGLKERGETPFDTVVRELREEANMDIRPLAVIDVQESEITLDIAVLCEVVKEHPFEPSPEIDDLLWVPPDKIAFELPLAQQKFIDAALRALGRAR